MSYGDRESVIGHGDRVVIRGALIAQKLGMDDLRIIKLRIACLLHDIGKIVISDAIVKKPGPLNDDEYAIVKSHAIVGQKILTELGMVEQAMWVRHHHERIDGKGYPDGLKRNQIPLESRIIFVADTYDAITSERPYRPTRTTEQAVEEIRRSVGTQLDPDCVQALVDIYESGELRNMRLA